MSLHALSLLLVLARPARADEGIPVAERPAAHALALRTAGQVTSGVALVGIAATLVAQTQGGELDRAYARIIGLTTSVPILAAGATMWGVGDHRLRRVAVTAVPALAPSAAGVVLLGRW